MSLVEALYGFDNGRSKRAIAENHKIADLKDKKGFVFEVLVIFFFSWVMKMIKVISSQVLSDNEGKHKGIYNHPIIQKAVNKIWFKNKRDEGIMFPDYFNPVSIPSIALILTVVSLRFSFLVINY